LGDIRYSSGAAVALQLALERPETVHTLALLELRAEMFRRIGLEDLLSPRVSSGRSAAVNVATRRELRNS
jgi:hypothetical protein